MKYDLDANLTLDSVPCDISWNFHTQEGYQRSDTMHGRPRSFKDKLKDPRAAEAYGKKVCAGHFASLQSCLYWPMTCCKPLM